MAQLQPVYFSELVRNLRCEGYQNLPVAALRLKVGTRPDTRDQVLLKEGLSPKKKPNPHLPVAAGGTSAHSTGIVVRQPPAHGLRANNSNPQGWI